MDARLSPFARFAALFALALLLPGCAQHRLTSSNCTPTLYPVVLDRASGIEAALAVDPNQPPPAPASYRDAVEASVRRRPAIESRQSVPQHLVLSGGGKWGSFGAGFLHALPNRPVFQVVTGISTGALQASFVFVGDQLVPAERATIYTRANDLELAASDPQPGQGRRFIDDLPRAYTVTRSESVIVVKSGVVSILRHGAAGEFGPLRHRLTVLLDRDMLQRIADAGEANGRSLFVGVVDVDDGQAYAIDLVDLAKRAVAPASDFQQAQQCYIDALIASSSEPLEVKPVFIGIPHGLRNPRMYMDGGARAGVFLQEILDKDDSAAIEKARPRIDTTVLVNGNLRVNDLTSDPAWSKNWNLVGLAMRTKDILVDQVYQFSVDRVLRFGSTHGAVRLATARNYEGHVFNGQPCSYWKTAEQKLAFPSTFMRCMIDYGDAKARSAAAWDVVLDSPEAKAAPPAPSAR